VRRRSHMPRHPWPSLALVAVLSVVSPAALTGQELTVSTETVEVPAELTEPIRALLQPETSVVMRDTNRIEIWWVKTIALDSAPQGAPSWSNVPDGALAGAIRVAQPLADARGYTIKPGVYTLRFALQPQDGDHLGVSPYRQFLLVAPAGDDQAPDAVGFKGAVALAKKALGKSHPSTLSLDPPLANESAGTMVTNDAGHKGVVFSVPTAFQGKSAGSMAFGLTLVGVYEH
jgi:hypothetical protein